jgi:hypothetical protein
MADSTHTEVDTNAIKDPEDWTTGDEPATGAQESYLHTLATEAHEDVPDDLTKADASRMIDDLQEKTGRGRCSLKEEGRHSPALFFVSFTSTRVDSKAPVNIS